jgi:hypothetical protein
VDNHCALNRNVENLDKTCLNFERLITDPELLPLGSDVV